MCICFFLHSVFPQICRTVWLFVYVKDRHREKDFLHPNGNKNNTHLTHTHKRTNTRAAVAMGIMWESAVIMNWISSRKSIFRTLDMPFEPLDTVVLQCNRQTICFLFPSFCSCYSIYSLPKQTNIYIYLFQSFILVTVWLFS